MDGGRQGGGCECPPLGLRGIIFILSPNKTKQNKYKRHQQMNAAKAIRHPYIDGNIFIKGAGVCSVTDSTVQHQFRQTAGQERRLGRDLS